MQQFCRYLVLSFAVLSVTAFGQSESIVIDDEQAEFTGRWQGIKEVAAIGSQFKYAMNSEETEPSSTATFRPKIPSAGRYHVEIHSTPGGNRSPKVPCVISSADGEISVVIDQFKRPGLWQRIADNVQFNAGTSGFVRIGNNGGAMPVIGKVVIADAVRFVPTGASEKGFQLQANAGAGGSILLNPKKKNFDPDTVVTLTAQAEDGYVFNGWSGDASGMENPLSLTMNKNKHITAGFVEGAAGVIMDASDAKLVGNWLPQRAQWGARTNYQYASTVIKETGTPVFAMYRPELSKAGLYDIYIWYSKGPNRADNAPWEIVGKKKPFTVNVNQQVRGGDWVPIANGVEFEAGTKGYVKLSNATGSVNYVVVADSVAFVYVGKP
ncbi:MAG: xly 1 [Verrucomicrobiales bacterium]|nr:xly 1 [Verrucomicrobiales bacterium]